MQEMNDFQKYIAKSRYAKYRDEDSRREEWDETVNRYMRNVVEPLIPIGDDNKFYELRDAIYKMEVLPSMRALMTAGEALDRDNVAGYNCSYLPVDHPRAFDETLYILMHGTGVGYSVERQYVSKLPPVPEELAPIGKTIVVEDSKEGWARALRKLIGALYAGDIPTVDYSKVRPYGARLKVFGGRASGPDPLRRLVDFTVKTFKGAQGRKLNSLECHDIMCKIGECIVSGGVRRSALISLSNLSDDRMRHAKDGQWWVDNPQRALANNSVAYTEKPDFDSFLREMTALFESRSGERGIFYRGAADNQVAKIGRRETGRDWGTNPCSEIILRPYQFCNLSSVVVRPDDTLDTLLRKVELATILGTAQATLTNFNYLRPIWRKNTEEERLLGVSLTGVMDHPVLSGKAWGADIGYAPDWLEEMKEKAIETNKVWALRFGINQAAAITCVKPEGTVSQLTDSASGLHARYAEFYTRRVRGDKADPISQFLKAFGVPNETDKMNPQVDVFSFPMRAPANAIFRNDLSAIEQLEHWKMLQDAWTEHKPSITVYYSEDEFLGMCQWVWDHFDEISGIAFLPRDTGSYEQAPYEDLTEAAYKAAVAAFPFYIPWDQFLENDDYTIASQTLACVGASCEVT